MGKNINETTKDTGHSAPVGGDGPRPQASGPAFRGHAWRPRWRRAVRPALGPVGILFMRDRPACKPPAPSWSGTQGPAPFRDSIDSGFCSHGMFV